MFFYGVILCVGGLGFIGYLALASEVMYVHWGATTANVMIGILSAVVDNIPVMFAVLTMHPDMSMGQWLLVTLTPRCGRQHALHRLGRGRRPDGTGAGHVHLLQPSEVDAGHRIGLCRQHPGPFLGQRRSVFDSGRATKMGDQYPLSP